MILDVEPDRDLTRFFSAYSIDTDLDAPRREPPESPVIEMASGDAALDQLLATIGGMSFGKGLYRVHRPESVAAWTTTIASAWKETANRIKVFAYDWLGRQFALYEGETILQFSAGDLEFVTIPARLFAFHDEELVTYRQEVLAFEFYTAWIQSGGRPPDYRTCIGYKKPIFLGGADWIENLEAIDMDVYWTVGAPVIARAREVGIGGVIGQIAIEE